MEVRIHCRRDMKGTLDVLRVIGYAVGSSGRGSAEPATLLFVEIGPRSSLRGCSGNSMREKLGARVKKRRTAWVLRSVVG